MTLPRAVVLALNAWTQANRRSIAEYVAHPNAFNDLAYCSACIRIPRAHNHCDTCDARLRMQKNRTRT